MSYNVYIEEQDGNRLVAEGVSYRETEAYRECCRKIVIQDTEQDAIIPSLPEMGSTEDDDLCRLYGVRPGALDSAKIVAGSIVGGALLVLIAIITQA